MIKNPLKHKCDMKKLKHIKLMGDRHHNDVQTIQVEYKCLKCGIHWYSCTDYYLSSWSGARSKPRWYHLPEDLWTLEKAG